MNAGDAAVPLSDLLHRSTADAGGSPSVDAILSAVRRHLGMDVAFVSEFRARDRIFRHVDADGAGPIRVGDAALLEDGYCQRVVDGRLPELIPDTSLVAEAMSQPATAAIPIGSHLSVPIRLKDGSLYGTFCCFGFYKDASLSTRDLGFMRAFADLVAESIDVERESERTVEAKRARIRSVIEKGQPAIVFQPIYNVRLHRLEGFECLSRFPAEPIRSPDQWFREAWDVGMGLELELTTIRNALHALSTFPSSLYLAVNCSPQVISSGRLTGILGGFDCSRVVLEITEHDSIDDYTTLREQIRPLRKLGVRIAIDDTGAGYASLRHVLHLDPDLIKLDMALTRGIDRDIKRRALAAALIAYAHQTGGRIVAEGVETLAERESLVSLGVDCLQGYLIGRPSSISDALKAQSAINIERGARESVPIREALDA